MIAPTPEIEPMEHETPDPPGRATRAPRARRPMRAISSQDALPRGWSGFGLVCSDCGGESVEEGKPPVWKFGTLPIIYIIEPESPAARAGFQVGDVLTNIDGVSLLDADGGRRFGAQKPGQTVRWKYLRGPKTLTATVVTERRVGERAIPLDELQERLKALGDSEELERLSPDMAKTYGEMAKRGLITPAPPRAQGRSLRYAGAVGGSEVEVRGLGTVIVDDSGDEIVITTRDATIRIRPAAMPAAAPQKRKSE
jgi:membrane-associated protease RseP (regulator of RpoE activity)